MSIVKGAGRQTITHAAVWWHPERVAVPWGHHEPAVLPAEPIRVYALDPVTFSAPVELKVGERLSISTTVRLDTD